MLIQSGIMVADTVINAL